MEHGLSKTATIVAVSEQISCDLAGEAAILNLKSGVYYGLDSVGARIWTLVQQPLAIPTIRDALLAEYDVEPEQCQRDLLALIAEMMAAGLIEVADAPPR